MVLMDRKPTSHQRTASECKAKNCPLFGGSTDSLYTYIPHACECTCVCTPLYSLQGQGGPECDFTPHTYSDTNTPTISPWCVFEPVMAPGSHIGVIPTGQFSAPGQTPKSSSAAHFKVSYIGAVSYNLNHAGSATLRPVLNSPSPPLSLSLFLSLLSLSLHADTATVGATSPSGSILPSPSTGIPALPHLLRTMMRNLQPLPQANEHSTPEPL